MSKDDVFARLRATVTTTPQPKKKPGRKSWDQIQAEKMKARQDELAKNAANSQHVIQGGILKKWNEAFKPAVPDTSWLTISNDQLFSRIG
jgi:hypothetical protein